MKMKRESVSCRTTLGGLMYVTEFSKGKKAGRTFEDIMVKVFPSVMKL